MSHHPYSFSSISENKNAGVSTIYFLIAAFSILIDNKIVQFLIFQLKEPLQWLSDFLGLRLYQVILIQLVSVSRSLLIFGLFYWLFNKILWRFLIDLFKKIPFFPDLPPFVGGKYIAKIDWLTPNLEAQRKPSKGISYAIVSIEQSGNITERIR